MAHAKFTSAVRKVAVVTSMTTGQYCTVSPTSWMMVPTYLGSISTIRSQLLQFKSKDPEYLMILFHLNLMPNLEIEFDSDVGTDEPHLTGYSQYLSKDVQD